MLYLWLKDVLLIEQSREQAGLGPRLYPPPSLKRGRRRHTTVCKVRVAQCVCIALTGSMSQTSRKQTPFLALGCEALSASGVFGVYVCLRALSASGMVLVETPKAPLNIHRHQRHLYLYSFSNHLILNSQAIMHVPKAILNHGA